MNRGMIGCAVGLLGLSLTACQSSPGLGKQERVVREYSTCPVFPTNRVNTKPDWWDEFNPDEPFVPTKQLVVPGEPDKSYKIPAGQRPPIVLPKGKPLPDWPAPEMS